MNPSRIFQTQVEEDYMYFFLHISTFNIFLSVTFTDNVNQIHFISRYLIHELIFKYTLFFELSVQLLCPISLQLVVFHFTELSLFKLCVNQNFVSCQK